MNALAPVMTLASTMIAPPGSPEVGARTSFPPGLRAAAAGPVAADRIDRSEPFAPAGRTGGIALITTPAAAAAIRSGSHQIRSVDGRPLRYPSQQLSAVESTAPGRPGQSHTLARHVGETLADDVDRLERHPQLRAAGGYADAASAQLATDRTIANPANQAAIGAFLADPGRLRAALARVDVGEVVGTSATRAGVETGSPALVSGRTATVVLIKDPTFPEGYRVLTSYPDTRGAEVDPQGAPIA